MWAQHTYVSSAKAGQAVTTNFSLILFYSSARAGQAISQETKQQEVRQSTLKTAPSRKHTTLQAALCNASSYLAI